MFGSEVLEVAIGIIFVFILVSIICTVVREGIEAWLKTRAAYLEYGIRELLHDKEAKGLARSFYTHPLIYSLFGDEYTPGRSPKRPAMFASGANLPSYIPTRNFAQALLDIAARGPATNAVSSDPNAPVISLDNLRANITNIRNESVQRVLLLAIDSAQGDINKVQANLEAWFDSSMDRVSGWYRRATQWILFWIGLVVAVTMNINTIKIADYLYQNESARTAIVARAGAAVDDTTFLNHNYEQVKNDLDALKLPIGWAGTETPTQKKPDNLWYDFFSPLLGWLLTALAATMGAPFWFDVLNKIMVIRSTVKPHEKSQEEASEDRQLPTPKEQAPVPEAGKEASFVPILPTGKLLADFPAPTDPESSIDACIGHDDHEHVSSIETVTADEELPVAEGGVAL